MLDETGTICFHMERYFKYSVYCPATEQSIKSFTFIFQGFFLDCIASANMFYIVIDYKNKTYVKVAASNINFKTHRLFSKQRILGVRVTIVQRKMSGDLTQTCF